ncbi:MAG TPA: DUF3667 domain-containing protein [Allosphingosinicella sp.]|nr:DUF3667 domain-containing protein [Allosphingosinicella sp.]
MTGLEGVGEAVTGGMIARAVEPQAGEAGEPGTACLNCGAALVGKYCHQCGQAARVRRTLRAFAHDVAHSVLHLDGKIWRTLPLLAWRPGELTRRYIDGERARFVSPMALFLFSVFMMFAVFSALGGPFSFGDSPAGRAEMAQEMREETAAAQQRLGQLKAERDRVRAAGGSTKAIEMSIASVEQELGVMEATSRVIATGSADAVEAAIAESGWPDEPGVANFQTSWPPLDAAIARANENPSLLLYKVQTNAYKFSWALIPISVPFVWLLFFWKRRFKLYDHTVFVTYSVAFMSLALIALSLVRPFGFSEAIAGLAITFVPPIHMYRQLRGAYALSRFGALWRTAFLLVSSMIAAGLFFTLLLALGAFA